MLINNCRSCNSRELEMVLDLGEQPPSNSFIKIEHIKFIMSKYELNADELIFFGDSSTDINAASAFNIPFILIKNSHNYNAFESYNGDYIKNFFDYKC